jgi:hypothetical protein
MKTAISLPDPLFRETEALAKQQGKTRSQLYRDALGWYVLHHAPDAVTDAYNALSGEVDTRLEPAVRKARSRLLRAEQW